MLLQYWENPNIRNNAFLLASHSVEKLSRRSIEGHSFCHSRAVLGPEVAISLGHKHATVLMSQPTGNCFKIDARFDAVGTKKMAKIMVSKMSQTSALTRTANRFFG